MYTARSAGHDAAERARRGARADTELARRATATATRKIAMALRSCFVGAGAANRSGWKRGHLSAVGAVRPWDKRAAPVGATLRSFSADAAADVLALNKQLLASISRMDFASYAEFMADDISCFEPEAGHQQVCVSRALGSTSKTHEHRAACFDCGAPIHAAAGTQEVGAAARAHAWHCRWWEKIFTSITSTWLLERRRLGAARQ